MESFEGKYPVLERVNSCMKYITQYGIGISRYSIFSELTNSSFVKLLTPYIQILGPIYGLEGYKS